MRILVVTPPFFVHSYQTFGSRHPAAGGRAARNHLCGGSSGVSAGAEVDLDNFARGGFGLWGRIDELDDKEKVAWHLRLKAPAGGMIVIVRSFHELVAEAAAADITGWGFDWLNGRATEERPPWGYAKLLADRLGQVESALDIDTGGGEVLAEAPALPPRMVATEAWPANAQRARELLGPRGVQIVDTVKDAPDESFELVTARHPVRPDWEEIYRVLAPGGYYFAQHVGPGSASELIEHFLGPPPQSGSVRDPQHECAAAHGAGLVVTDLRTARCRMEFYDVGAVVWILRKCVWWVPGFSVQKYRDKLAGLDARMRGGEPVVSHSTRHLIEARRPLSRS